MSNVLDLDSVGGGGMGMGGFGNNPLLWLITLGFLGGRRGLGFGGDEGGGAAIGTTVGENSAKLDCLSQGQASLQSQLNQQNIDSGFQGITNQLSTLNLENRAIQDAIFRENAATQRQLAECCCETKTAIQGVNTSIALQTNEINSVATANTQKILDQLCQNNITNLATENAKLRGDLTTAEILAAIAEKK